MFNSVLICNIKDDVCSPFEEYLTKQLCNFKNNKRKKKVLVLLIELCPLSELRKLSTEPPAFSFGFSRESMSG